VATKKLTILHSNDMHGDFLAEVQGAGGRLVGGLALLSGYINRVRREEENVIYAVSGDMLQGSVIDSEYRGISTIEVMNYLAPDVVTLGNHEFDYGLPHLLFLEKMANFPIVNANLYIRKQNKRLMQPHLVLARGGIKVLCIGIITETVIEALRKDAQIASFITLKEAGEEVGRIAGAYRRADIDLTVLLTHIGFESDCELARLLRPEWGVDLIIGGHSHTVLQQPACVNNILIAQAGVGTDQIGRFDLEIDDANNSIAGWRWQLIPIDQSLTEPDRELEAYIDSLKSEVDRKYSAIVCKLARRLTHPRREIETALGNLLADAVAEMAAADVALLGSGAIRVPQLGPLVTLGGFLACYPFSEPLTRFTVSGALLRRMFNHWMRPENRSGEGECYQVNGAVRAVYSERARQVATLTVRGRPVQDGETYTVALAGYHVINCEANLGVTSAELAGERAPRVVTTAIQDVLLEYLRENQNASRIVEGRLVYQA